MPFVISKDPIEVDPSTESDSGFTIGGEVTPDGAPIYGEDDILTKAGWRYRKKTTDTDILQGAVQAAKGLWNGFAKIPEVVRAKGFTGASGNLPEAMLAAGEGWADIVKTVASKNYAVVTGMSEEQDLDRQYANYREVAERSVEQVKRSRSRVGDFFRAIGAPEQAAPYDESIDQETSNALSMVLDPTNLIGGGSLKAMLAAGKGAKVAVAGEKAAVAGEKAAVAGEKALQAAEKVSAEVAETTAKVVPPIRDGPAPINWNEPVAKATRLAGKGAEKTGRGLQSVADSLVAWEKANPNWATAGSAAIGAASNEENPLTGAFIGAGARTVLPSILKTAPKALVTAGEAAQVAAIASREGLDVAAKSGVAGEKVSAIAKRLDTPAVNFLLSQSAQLADAAAKGMVIGGGLGYAVNNDPEVSGLGSGIGAGIVGGPMGRLQSIGIDQAGRVAFHKPDADGKWVRVSESPASMAKDQALAVSFLASRSLPERTVLAERLSVAQLAELARGEAAAKGANRATGEDMEVRFLDADGMVAAGFDPTVSKVMQGVTETDQKPTLYVNLDVATDPAKTLWHEAMHGFDKLAPDEVGGKQTDAGAALDQTRAELKAFYFGSYDASGKQTVPGKYNEAQFLKLEDQYLSRIDMSEAEMTAHMGQPMTKRVAYIADEMAAEHAGMLGRLSGGDIGKASRYPSTALGRAALGVLGRTRVGLESLGIVFDGGGEVVTSGIFKDPETGKPLSMSNDVREKLSAYLRAKDKITTRMSVDFDESPITEVVNARDLAKASTTPEMLARWKNSGMFALDDKGEIRMMGGKPVFLTAAERKKVDANRSLAIFTAIKAVPDDGSPGLRSEVIDGVETFKGTKLSKAQVDAVLALPDAVLPPSVKDRISELVKLQEVPGGPIFADYNKAITGGRYDSKASISTQIFVPMSLSITAAGNFIVTSFSVVGFERKVAMWKKTKKKFFEPWDGNMDSFHNDVRTYLNNQESGAGNVAVGKEAITKKNAINDFLASVLVGDMNRVSTKSNSDNLIRSFRVDRMQSIERAGGDNMPYDYGKVRANFMPYAGESATPPQFMRDSLDTAKAMAAAGKTSEEIRAITGWFPGKYDGKMRFEVPDEGATLVESKDWIAHGGSTSTERGSRLKDVINHPELLAAYPEVGNVTVDAVYGHVDGKGLPREGSYTHRDPKIHGDGARSTIKASGATKAQVLSTILHEVQHWIQAKEGFARGAHPDMWKAKHHLLHQKVESLNAYMKQKLSEGNKEEYRAAMSERDDVVQEILGLEGRDGIVGADQYQRTAGEIESRDVQARQRYTPEQRKAVAPYSSENIATEDAIVLSRNGGQERFQPSDTDYLAAVKSGDMKVVQRMVDEAAKKAGYSIGPLFHGTGADFTTFKMREGRFGKGIYLSPTVERAEAYAKEAGRSGGNPRVLRLYANNDVFSYGGKEFMARKPSQIKSADPITRDAQGNVIPLSKRFNTTSEDIRYQPADENPTEAVQKLKAQGKSPSEIARQLNLTRSQVKNYAKGKVPPPREKREPLTFDAEHTGIEEAERVMPWHTTERDTDLVDTNSIEAKWKAQDAADLEVVGIPFQFQNGVATVVKVSHSRKSLSRYARVEVELKLGIPESALPEDVWFDSDTRIATVKVRLSDHRLPDHYAPSDAMVAYGMDPVRNKMDELAIRNRTGANFIASSYEEAMKKVIPAALQYLGQESRAALRQPGGSKPTGVTD